MSNNLTSIPAILCIILLGLFLNIAPHIHAQNLIANGDFENHEKIQCLECHVTAKTFHGLMRNTWQNLNSGTVVCDCSYAKQSEEKRWPWCPEFLCNDDANTSMQFEYVPTGWDDAQRTRGISSYLSTTFTEPLTIGHQYRLSVDIYIPSANDIDPDFPMHIGIRFSPNDPNARKNRQMLEQAHIYFDTIIYDTWYTTDWIIQPTCHLSYMTLGTFKSEDWPAKFTFDHSFFFIDNVRLEKIKNRKPEVQLVCHPVDKIIEEQAHLTDAPLFELFFESNSAELSAAEKAKLDSLGFAMKSNPSMIYMVEGHTDATGTNHETLSAQRCQHVKAYLMRTFNIPDVRLLTRARGIEKLRSSEIHAKNRRVTIRQSTLSIAEACYIAALEAVKSDDLSLAFRRLNTWVHCDDNENKILTLFDHRMNKVRNDVRWKPIEKAIRNRYNKYKKPRLSFQLDSLLAEDQKYRSLEFELRNLSGGYLMDEFSIVPFITDSVGMLRHDMANLSAIDYLIDFSQHPTRADVGKRQLATIFFVIDHCRDVDRMKQYLPQLASLCATGDMDWKLYATLFDRIQYIHEKPQKYGTQFVELPDKSGTVLYKTTQLDSINIYRQYLGISPLSEYVLRDTIYFKQ